MRLMHGDCLGPFEIARKRIEDAQRERESKMF